MPGREISECLQKLFTWVLFIVENFIPNRTLVRQLPDFKMNFKMCHLIY